jgi:hypothetical protein
MAIALRECPSRGTGGSDPGDGSRGTAGAAFGGVPHPGPRRDRASPGGRCRSTAQRTGSARETGTPFATAGCRKTEWPRPRRRWTWRRDRRRESAGSGRTGMPRGAAMSSRWNGRSAVGAGRSPINGIVGRGSNFVEPQESRPVRDVHSWVSPRPSSAASTGTPKPRPSREGPLSLKVTMPAILPCASSRGQPQQTYKLGHPGPGEPFVSRQLGSALHLALVQAACEVARSVQVGPDGGPALGPGVDPPDQEQRLEAQEEGAQGGGPGHEGAWLPCSSSWPGAGPLEGVGRPRPRPAARPRPPWQRSPARTAPGREPGSRRPSRPRSAPSPRVPLPVAPTAPHVPARVPASARTRPRGG